MARPFLYPTGSAAPSGHHEQVVKALSSSVGAVLLDSAFITCSQWPLPSTQGKVRSVF